jgi:hypothetical protein
MSLQQPDKKNRKPKIRQKADKTRPIKQFD